MYADWNDLNKRCVGHIDVLWSKLDKAGVPKDDPSRTVKLAGSFPDCNFFEDKDGNIWDEYVPTWD